MPGIDHTPREGAPAVKGKRTSPSRNGSNGTRKAPPADKAVKTKTPLPRLAETTSEVVYQAASILEEEIAAGIVAAKQVETDLIKSTGLSQNERNVVLQRFRKDLHEVVDMVLDVVDVAVQYADVAGQPAGTARKPKPPQKGGQARNGHLPTLTPRGSVRAGTEAAVMMNVVNGADKSSKLRFVSTDLTSTSGGQIAAQQVTFLPEAVSLKPHQAEDIEVTVGIASDQPPGTYMGLIQAAGKDRPEAVLVIRVS